MAKYVTTKTAAGGSSGGGGGITLADVCNTICTLNTSCDSDGINSGFSCWRMICNCPCWTDCYGCNVVWNVDTLNYRAIRLYYTGIRQQKCCWMYICPGFGSDTCYCCCSNAYRGYCVCNWPVKSCCCWTAYNCCHLGKDTCIYCCNGAYDDLWSMQFTVCAPNWKGCYEQGGGIFYSFWYKKYGRAHYTEYDYTGWDITRGYSYCSCINWNCDQGDVNAYLTKLCLMTTDTPFQSALADGTYNSGRGGACSVGVPCWTIWGVPCNRPCFGSCSMITS
jgi:hypothetical protein